MKNTNTCPKCGKKNIVRFDGFAGPYGSGNHVMTGATVFSAANVNRYVCCDCGSAGILARAVSERVVRTPSTYSQPEWFPPPSAVTRAVRSIWDIPPSTALFSLNSTCQNAPCPGRPS